MIQEIIALAIIFVAGIYTIYQAILFFRPIKHGKANSGCGYSCSSCPVKSGIF
jgi:hypothetical protein